MASVLVEDRVGIDPSGNEYVAEYAEVPQREDGSKYPFALIAPTTPGTVFSDSLTELDEGIIDGYDEAEDDDDALWMRVNHLATLAWQAQASTLLHEGNREDSPVRFFDEDTITAVFADKLDILDFDEWAVKYPLFLLTTSYAPYTQAPRPKGDWIVWLDPYTERTYLEALAHLGYCEVVVIES